jgi:hypothetical protein
MMRKRSFLKVPRWLRLLLASHTIFENLVEEKKATNCGLLVHERAWHLFIDKSAYTMIRSGFWYVHHIDDALLSLAAFSKEKSLIFLIIWISVD